MTGAIIAQANPVLETVDLAVQCRTASGKLDLLQGIHLRLEAGRVLGIVGESGSGKSLTCHAILGLLHRTQMQRSGQVRLQGQELTAYSERQMRRVRGAQIGTILQNPMNAFMPLHTIGTQFVQTLRTHDGTLSQRQALRIAVEGLDSMGLPHPQRLLRQYPFQLSGGMLQRIMIALSMCLKPKLLIADEPTTALDLVSQLQVLRALDRLRRECGTAILLVSHDLGVIAQMADDVAVMRHGRIVEQGSVHQLFDDPKHEYTRLLLDSRMTAYHPLEQEQEQEQGGKRDA